MNNSQSPVRTHFNLSGDPVLCCGNCRYLRERDLASGAGQCFYEVPQIVVVLEPRADVALAQQGVVQVPKPFRVTMQPVEFCGHFVPDTLKLN